MLDCKKNYRLENLSVALRSLSTLMVGIEVENHMTQLEMQEQAVKGISAILSLIQYEMP